MIELKDTELPCPSCGSGTLFEPVTVDPSLGYLPVRCRACSFTGRRVNLIVVPDQKHGESWKGIESV
jgi:hypothetical protein